MHDAGSPGPSRAPLGLALALLTLAACAKAPGAPPPQPPPQIASSSPAAGASRVPVDAPVRITFSRPLAAATVNGQSFTLSSAAGPVAGSVSLAGATATFTPAAPLANGTAHAARLEATVQGEDGVALGSAVEIPFTTVPVARFAYAESSGRMETYALDSPTGALVRRAAAGYERPPFAETKTAIHPGGRFAFYTYKVPAPRAPNVLAVHAVDPEAGTFGNQATLNGVGNIGASPVPDPVRDRVYVPDGLAVAVVSVSSGVPTHVSGSPFDVGGAEELAADPSGRRVFVRGGGALRVLDVDASTGALLAAPPGPYPTTASGPLALTADGRVLLVADGNAESVASYRVDPGTGALAAAPGSAVAAPDLTGPLFAVAGRLAVAAGRSTLHAWTIDPASGTLTALPGSPAALNGDVAGASLDPDGACVVVALAGSRDLLSFRLGTRLEQASGSPFALGATPKLVAFEPSGRRLLAHTESGLVRLEADGAGTLTRVAELRTRSILSFDFGRGSAPLRHLPARLYAARSDAALAGFAIDPATGALAPLAGSPFALSSAATSLAADAPGRRLFAALSGGTVAAFDLGATTGAPSLLASGGVGTGLVPRSLALDPTGLTAFTIRGGTLPAGEGPLAILGLSGGALTMASPGGDLIGASPEPFSVYADPAGRFLFYPTGTFCSLGAAGPMASPAPVAGSPWPLAVTCVGTGSAAVDGPGAFAFGLGAGPTGGIAAFAIDPATGALTHTDGRSGLTSGTAAVAADPLGRFVYASLPNGRLVGYAVDGAGLLTDLPARGAGTSAGTLAVDPTGQFLYVGNGAGEIHAFRIAATGELAPVAGSPFSAGAAVTSLAATSDCR
jgi:6-phosphogluconolactonase (cycloisomerase 2 family)